VARINEPRERTRKRCHYLAIVYSVILIDRAWRHSGMLLHSWVKRERSQQNEAITLEAFPRRTSIGREKIGASYTNM
jgi:hypothetical protein